MPNLRTDVVYIHLNSNGVGPYVKMGTGKQDAVVSYLGDQRYYVVAGGYAATLDEKDNLILYAGVGTQFHRTKYQGSSSTLVSPMVSVGFMGITRANVVLFLGADMALMNTVSNPYYIDKHSNYDWSLLGGVGFKF